MDYGPSPSPTLESKPNKDIANSLQPNCAHDVWVVGVLLALFAAAGVSLGIILFKLSQARELRRELPLKQRHFVCQPLWQFAFLIFTIANGANVASLAFAPQSMLAPLGGFSLVVNALAAAKLLGEKINRRDFGATVLIIFGSVISTVFHQQNKQRFTENVGTNIEEMKSSSVCEDATEPLTSAELWVEYQRIQFVLFGIIAIVCCSTLYCSIKLMERRIATSDPEHPPPPSKIWAIVEKFVPMVVSTSRLQFYGKALPVCYGSLTGFFGSWTILSAKGAMELLNSTFRGHNQMTHWLIYVILLVVAYTAFSQIYWLNHGLAVYDALLLYPVFFVFFTLLTIAGGGVNFSAEFKHFRLDNILGFGAGVIITLTGVVILAQREALLMKKEEEAINIELMNLNAERVRRFPFDMDWLLHAQDRMRAHDRTDNSARSSASAGDSEARLRSFTLSGAELASLGLTHDELRRHSHELSRHPVEADEVATLASIKLALARRGADLRRRSLGITPLARAPLPLPLIVSADATEDDTSIAGLLKSDVSIGDHEARALLGVDAARAAGVFDDPPSPLVPLADGGGDHETNALLHTSADTSHPGVLEDDEALSVSWEASSRAGGASGAAPGAPSPPQLAATQDDDVDGVVLTSPIDAVTPQHFSSHPNSSHASPGGVLGPTASSSPSPAAGGLAAPSAASPASLESAEGVVECSPIAVSAAATPVTPVPPATDLS